MRLFLCIFLMGCLYPRPQEPACVGGKLATIYIKPDFRYDWDIDITLLVLNTNTQNISVEGKLEEEIHWKHILFDQTVHTRPSLPCIPPENGEKVWNKCVSIWPWRGHYCWDILQGRFCSHPVYIPWTAINSNDLSLIGLRMLDITPQGIVPYPRFGTQIIHWCSCVWHKQDIDGIFCLGYVIAGGELHLSYHIH